MEEAKETLKKGAKIAVKVFVKILPILLPIIIIIVLLAAATYFITIDDGTYKEDDWGSTPYAAGEYTNAVSVNRDGSLSSGRSAQELWDTMLENGGRVDEYLDSPEELVRLMRAEIVTQYPDTRSNPNADINWQDIVNSDTLQGIIKFKRADSNNNISNLTYVDEDTFNEWVQNGDRQALNHFTLKRSRASTSNSINYTGPDLCWPVEPQFTAITSYFGPRGPVEGVPGASTDHGAIDIGDAGIDGTNTYACEAGTVTQSTNNGDHNGGAGNWVVIDHGNGYVTKYMHMQTGSVTVQAGDTVTKGQVIGLVGTTGNSSGPHCHFQIEYNGVKIDPLSFKYNNGMGNGTGGFGISSTNDEANSNNRTSTNDEANDREQTSTDDEANENNRQGSTTRPMGVTTVNGDGYREEYTSSAGITYKHYKQYEGSYASNSYWSGTISSSGCGPTSLAILASGIVSSNYTPADIASEMNSRYGYTGPDVLKQEMESLGMSAEKISNPTADQIKTNLENGKVMLVGVNPGTFTSVGHWMAIVDVNTAGEVYICNPGSSTLYGWYDANFIASETATIIVTDAGAAGMASGGGSAQSSNSASYTAVVATWKQVDTTVTTNDPNVEASNDTVYTMTTTNINYQEMVNPYTMPFDLLWALLVVGEDKDFVFELADLIYGSDIQITIYDNLKTNTDVDDWTYTKETKAVVDATITANCNGESETGQIRNDVHDPDSEANYKTTKTVVTQTNTVNAVLTKADVWIVDYQNDYTYVAPTTSPSTTSEVSRPNQNYPNSPDRTGDSYSCEHIDNKKQELESIVRERAAENNRNSANEDEATSEDEDETNYSVDFSENIRVKYYDRYVDIKDNITNTIETQKYIEGTPSTREKTDKESTEDNFVTIFNKSEYRRNKSNTLNVASWLFEIIETNPSTSNMVDLMKYLLYKATDNDYGVTEDDVENLMDLLHPNLTNTSGTSSLEGEDTDSIYNYLIGQGLTNAGAAGVMGNLEAESHFLADSVESWYLYGDEYRIEYTRKVDSGEISRHDFIHNGPNGNGYGIAGFTWWELKRDLYDMAKQKGKSIGDLELQLEFLVKTFREKYTSLWNTITTSNDLYTCTYAMLDEYERPAYYNIEDRYSYAQKYYK